MRLDVRGKKPNGPGRGQSKGRAKGMNCGVKSGANGARSMARSRMIARFAIPEQSQLIDDVRPIVESRGMHWVGMWSGHFKLGRRVSREKIR